MVRRPPTLEVAPDHCISGTPGPALLLVRDPWQTRIVRVVVAEDVMLTREGIVRVLADAGLEVVGTSDDVGGLMRVVATQKPDCAIVDIRMPPSHTDEGIVAAREIRDRYPEVAVLVLSQYVDPGFALRLLEDNPGRSGYLLKERVADPAILVDALRRLTEGDTVVDPWLVSRLLSRRRDADPVEELSSREREVLALVAEGLSNAAIARKLFITERTVEAHVKEIFLELGIAPSADANRRVLAVLAFLRSGVTEAPGSL
jgi:DNA-binding NarL/FixJ family response regulator